jgi:hypothetical protein
MRSLSGAISSQNIDTPDVERSSTHGMKILRGWENAKPGQGIFRLPEISARRAELCQSFQQTWDSGTTLYRLTNCQRSATLRKTEKILRSQDLSLADAFDQEGGPRSGIREAPSGVAMLRK